MEEQFVPLEIARKLKELGFDEGCLARYEYRSASKMEKIVLEITPIDSQTTFSWQVASAPLWQQVIDWFREKHDLFINIFKWDVKYYFDEILQSPRFLFDIDSCKKYTTDYIYQSINDEIKYYSYTEAREQSILKAIELLSNS